VIRKSIGLSPVLFMIAFALLSGQAQVKEPLTPTANNADTLRYVVIVSRHGVRSPTGKTDQLNQYSTQPWPAWTVPPGYLTEHGATLMRLFGAYDRELLVRQGLLTGNGCSDAGQITILADSDQRTRETGKALASGLMPNCSLDVHALSEGTPDPLFHPLSAGDLHADKQLATAALAGRIGNNPAGLVEAYRPQLQALEDVLTRSASTGMAAGAPSVPKASLFDIPSSIAPGKGDHLVDLRSPLGTAATMAENLLLEYTEGMPQVGWGRVDATTLRELMQLHTASADLERRTGYIARVQSAPMLSGILDSMQQAIDGKPLAGALGKLSHRLLILVGHDTNLTNISGALDLSWLIDGRRDDTPPGGALVFELWQKGTTSKYLVRTYYTAQTLDQMRHATPLSLVVAPDRVPVFIPRCSQADFACEWKDFAAMLREAIDVKLPRD
jgi:4-phytase/acid phosphatase